MSRLVSIDPGVRVLGACFFAYGEFRYGTMSRTKARDLSAQIAEHVANLITFQADEAAVESMRYRPTDSTPQDLINVQSVGCAVGAMLTGRLRLYPASEWKGTVPKHIHHPRLRAVLSDEERARLDEALARCPKGRHKEILDALGIGLYHLGRINRSGGPRR